MSRGTRVKAMRVDRLIFTRLKNTQHPFFKEARLHTPACRVAPRTTVLVLPSAPLALRQFDLWQLKLIRPYIHVATGLTTAQQPPLALWDRRAWWRELATFGLALGFRALVAALLQPKGGAQVVWIRGLRNTCCSQFDSNT
eukprot:scaffold108954_cov68-Phaeocystis_antarctica.AAC.1